MNVVNTNPEIMLGIFSPIVECGYSLDLGERQRAN